MCGIIGGININIGPEELALLKHRGPDAQGLISFKTPSGNLQMGHTRLSIVDLSDRAAQPMTHELGRHTIVFNGEIYNHQDLRNPAKAYRSHSDTETVLNYIIERGIDKISDFNGIFAFAFYDSVHNELYLARDRFGIKPLYYRRSGERRFMFSSEIKPLINMENDKMDQSRLSELLRLRYNPSPDTLFQNIHKLSPGHYLRISLGKSVVEVEERSFYRHDIKQTILSYRDAVDEYGRLFEQAVSRQLMSDVEVGVLLSGGVDSALVSCFAKNSQRGKMKAFTVGFDIQDRSNELQEARRTAEILGLEYIERIISAEDFFSVFRKCVKIVEEPVASTSVIPMYYLAEEAAKHVKVVLTGQGADEPLGGYRRYQGELLGEKIPRWTIRALHKLMLNRRVKSEALKRGLQSLYETDIIERFMKVYQVFNEADILKLTGIPDTLSREKIEHTGQFLFSNNPGVKDLQKMMSLDLRMNLADDLLLYTDKITMAHSLECRVPILDNTLIRFIESLPLNYKVSLGQTKKIHKCSASRYLPGEIIQRKKRGFESPTRHWFLKYGNIIRGMLGSGESAFSGYFDKKEVDKVFENHERGLNQEKQIFLLLSIYFWMEEFL